MNWTGSRIGDHWLALLEPSDGRRVCAAFDLTYPVRPSNADFVQALALIDLGICEASVIPEPRFRRSARKAARDAALERPTIHMAPTWRHAEPDETGLPALILPVVDEAGRCRTISLKQADEADWAGLLVDLIAIPTDGSRPLSLTGHTLAVGSLEATAGRLWVWASGLAWLRSHLQQVQADAAVAGWTPSQPAHELALAAPDAAANLAIEPMAMDWRISSPGCVIPYGAREIIVPDSAALASAIDALMRIPVRMRPMPTVLVPSPVIAKNKEHIYQRHE